MIKKSDNNAKRGFTPLEIYEVLKRMIRNVPRLLFTPPKSLRSASLTGFTLVEIIIATGLFTILVVAVVDIIIASFKAQRKISNIQTVQDNIRFSLDLMTREMRTGEKFRIITHACPFNLGNGIEFTNLTAGERRYYYLADRDGDTFPDSIMRVAMTGDIDINCALAAQFTADEVIVDYMRFYLNGQVLGPSDGQPRITIVLGARSRDQKIVSQTSINIQTSITPRVRDLP